MKKIILWALFALCGSLLFAKENSATGLTELPKIAPPQKDIAQAEDLLSSTETRDPVKDSKYFNEKLEASLGWTIISIICEDEYRSLKNDKVVQDMLRNSGVQNQ